MFRYTSQRWEDKLGLYDYNACYYDLTTARFLSCHSRENGNTLVPDPANPQQFNRFAYVLNNPLRFTDPTGHLSEDEINHYFGCDKDEARNAWGDELFGLLWNTELTWGSEGVVNQLCGLLLIQMVSFYVPLQWYARKIECRVNKLKFGNKFSNKRLLSIFIAYLVWFPPLVFLFFSVWLSEYFGIGSDGPNGLLCTGFFLWTVISHLYFWPSPWDIDNYEKQKLSMNSSKHGGSDEIT